MLYFFTGYFTSLLPPVKLACLQLVQETLLVVFLLSQEMFVPNFVAVPFFYLISYFYRTKNKMWEMYTLYILLLINSESTVAGDSLQSDDSDDVTSSVDYITNNCQKIFQTLNYLRCFLNNFLQPMLTENHYKKLVTPNINVKNKHLQFVQIQEIITKKCLQNTIGFITTVVLVILYPWTLYKRKVTV